MANLEVAADELVRKLKSVDDEVAETRQGLARLKDQVASLGDALDEQWIEVARAAADLIETAGEELATLGNETQEAVQAVVRLEGTGHAAQEAAQAGLEAAEQGTSSFDEAVDQRAPQMDGAAEAGDQSLEALETQASAIATRLEEVMQRARDFLTGEVVSALESMQAAIADRCQEIHTTLTEECAATLQQGYEEWTERLEEVLSLVEEEGFTAMQIQGQQVVDWALEEAEHEYEQEQQLLQDVARLVGQMLETLRDEAIPEAADQVGGDEGASALGQAVAETGSALEAMIAALDACRQVMSRYSFVAL